MKSSDNCREKLGSTPNVSTALSLIQFMNTKDKIILTKLAEILSNQQRIIKKLSQQALDKSKPQTDPLGQVVHDAALAWQTKNRLSASTKFDAGVDGKHYDVNVALTITDPRKPAGNALPALKASFTATLQSTFDQAAKNGASELSGCTATFSVTIV